MKPDRPLDPSIVEECHREWRDTLERYAWAVVRDRSLAADAVQNAFVALARFGGDVNAEARKAWLYKVVHREAVRIRTVESRQQFGASDLVSESPVSYHIDPLNELSSLEDVHRIRHRLNELSPEQREVIQLRIFEDKTFAEIASQLSIPLGTALSRMRLAIQKLREGESE
jgi:RNA polymerase sigma-70 factor (ECF subfamily)